MKLRRCFALSLFLGVAALLLMPLPGLAQRTAGAPPAPGAGPDAGFDATVMVLVRDQSGSIGNQMALVTLYRMDGGLVNQGTTQAGQIQFDGVKGGSYVVRVSAAGYDDSQQSLNVEGGVAIAQFTLRPLSDATAAAQKPPGMPTLSPKAQKLFSKVIEELRASDLNAARSHLQEVYRMAPGNPEVNYLYGLYEAEANDWAAAKSYWKKTLEIYPKHVGALLQLSQAALREKQPAEALPYLEQATEDAPNSWRPHALKSQALYEQGQYPQAVKEADRALELGHSQAIAVQVLLAQILLKQGDKSRAIEVLQGYLKERPTDIPARRVLDSLTAPPAAPDAAPAPPPPPAAIMDVSPILNSTWKPPDVDDSVPAVKAGVPCWQENVLRQAGRRVVELVKNVERFTATEQLYHELFNSGGLSGPPIKRKFNYLVTVDEVHPGLLSIEEYRGLGSLADFPDNLATRGLPGLVLVFHPFQQENFSFACEGLAQLSSGLAWQVHFQPRPDRPYTLQTYTSGGQSYPILLKGRAWIAADSFQVVRLESDLVRPLPQVRLKTEHTVIEYGPVHFRSKNLSLWLPQSADVYFDWQGKRIHRRHSFSDYLLFTVDDKQKYKIPPAPEADAGSAGAASSSAPAPPAKPASPQD